MSEIAAQDPALIDWDGLWPVPDDADGDGSQYGETAAADGTPGAPNDGTVAGGQ